MGCPIGSPVAASARMDAVELQPTPGFEADFQSSVGEIHDLDPLATAILAEPAFAEDRVVLIENTAELQCSAQTRSRC